VDRADDEHLSGQPHDRVPVAVVGHRRVTGRIIMELDNPDEGPRDGSVVTATNISIITTPATVCGAARRHITRCASCSRVEVVPQGRRNWAP